MGSFDVSDKQIVAWLLQACHGDERACEALVRTIGPKVVNVLKSECKLDRDDRLSVFHDQLMKLIRNPSLFDPAKGSFGTFILTMAVNSARDRLRIERKHPRQSDEGALDTVEASVMPFFDQIAIREEAGEMAKSFRLFAKDREQLDRDLVELFLSGGMTGAWACALGDAHGVTAQAVAVRWHRLRIAFLRT